MFKIRSIVDAGLAQIIAILKLNSSKQCKLLSHTKKKQNEFRFLSVIQQIRFFKWTF